MPWAWLEPFADLGVTAVLGLAAMIIAYRVVKIGERIGNRMATAQETTAEALARLVNDQADQRYTLASGLETLELAISQVDQRAALQAQHIGAIEIDLRELRNHTDLIGAVSEKLDRLLTQSTGGQ
ncbi:MAG: hypothetical protein P9L99_13340 [Candidatus Lernaella stagnicola]|nr:hypothetical protein [Candidatus Lernaella stagnicola]